MSDVRNIGTAIILSASGELMDWCSYGNYKNCTCVKKIKNGVRF